jgi:pimeloyl-ACP methyl ester carboxylesterase
LNRRTTFALTTTLLAIVSVAEADVRVGSFRESSTVVEVAGEEWAASFASYVDADQKVTWSVVVPENYDPEVPAGILVYISPGNSGRMVRDWGSVLDNENLIWVSAGRSGNSIDPRKRIAYALLGPTLIAKNYNVDPDRIYVAGLSGGGRVASIVAPSYPTLFTGAIYICGVNPIAEQLASNIESIQPNRFVFVTGEDDFNRIETRKVYDEYIQSGMDNSHYLEFKRMGHENPDAEGLAEAIALLDSE